MQRRAGVVAQREQHLVVELLEAALAVRADHDAGEVVADVDRDGHQVLDLLVGRAPLAFELGALVLAHGLVALHDLAGKALAHRAVLRIVVEAQRADEVEGAVGVLVGLGEEQALLGLGEVDGHLQDELAHVVGVVAEHGVVALQAA